MEHSTTYGPNYKHKINDSYPINEILANKTKNSYYKNQEHIQPNKHNERVQSGMVSCFVLDLPPRGGF